MQEPPEPVSGGFFARMIGRLKISLLFSDALSNPVRPVRPLMSTTEDVDEISLHRASRLRDLLGHVA